MRERETIIERNLRQVILPIVFLLAVIALPSHAQLPVALWQGTTVRADDVMLTPYLPEHNPTGTAVIVCPGGSYCWLDRESEGELVGQWLKASGVAAFVLKYRTAGIGAFVTRYRMLVRGNQYPDMLCDLQRAIQWVRENAESYGVFTDRVGVMGFSAGGHLAMMAGVSRTDFLTPLGLTPEVPLRPDFLAPIYPVVTFSDETLTHRRSRRGLLGEWRKSKRMWQDSLSVEKQVRPDCPPVFLLHCMDDPVVKYGNSMLLDSALTAQNIPHTYIRYQTGGHGFGANPRKGSPESALWRNEFLKWLNTLFE